MATPNSCFFNNIQNHLISMPTMSTTGSKWRETIRATQLYHIISLNPPLIKIMTWNNYRERSYMKPMLNMVVSDVVRFTHGVFWYMGKDCIQCYKMGNKPAMIEDSLYLLDYMHSENTTSIMDRCNLQGRKLWEPKGWSVCDNGVHSTKVSGLHCWTEIISFALVCKRPIGLFLMKKVRRSFKHSHSSIQSYQNITIHSSFQYPTNLWARTYYNNILIIHPTTTWPRPSWHLLHLEVAVHSYPPLQALNALFMLIHHHFFLPKSITVSIRMIKLYVE